MASDCLFVQPPVDLALDAETDIAARPVHHRNVGLPAGAPLDAYWRRIYASVGIDDVAMTVHSFVEDEPLRAYFNAASRPYHLHSQVPVDRRPVALDDLICAATEDLSLDPDTIDDVEIRDPLRTWLSARAYR